jgi:hypothetical protein
LLVCRVSGRTELLVSRLARLSPEERAELSAFTDLADIVADRLDQPSQPVLIAPGLSVLRGPYGTGVGPVDPAPAMRCGNCGMQYFNGARCVWCGTMDDD